MALKQQQKVARRSGILFMIAHPVRLRLWKYFHRNTKHETRGHSLDWRTDRRSSLWRQSRPKFNGPSYPPPKGSFSTFPSFSNVSCGVVRLCHKAFISCCCSVVVLSQPNCKAQTPTHNGHSYSLEGLTQTPDPAVQSNGRTCLKLRNICFSVSGSKSQSTVRKEPELDES